VAAAVVAAGLGGIPAVAYAASRPVPADHVSRPAAARSVDPASRLAGTVTGVLRGPNGRAVSGACITATGEGRSVTSRIGSTGRYFLAGLRPGPYEVRAVQCAAPSAPDVLRDGRTYELTQAAHVVVQPGHLITLTSASLHPVRLVMATPAQERAMARAAAQASGPGTISGVVRNSRGKPLAGICVTVWSFSGNNGGGIGVTTGRNGSYTVEPASAGLPRRGLRVQFSASAMGCGNKGNYAPQWWKNVVAESKSTPLTVNPGTHLKNIGATMTVGGEFSGVVRSTTKSGHPLRGICITAISTNISDSFFYLPPMTFTAANGTYTVDDLGSGKYYVLVQPGGNCGGKSYGNDDYLPVADPHAVKVVVGKHTNGIDFVLRLGGILAGTVESGGLGVEGACVDLVEDGIPVEQFGTGPGGAFLIQQLTPARYQIAFTGGCGNTGSLAPQFYPDAINAEDAATLTLTYGQTRSSLDATMLSGATISGRVTNSQGKTLGQVCVAPVSPQELGPIPNNLSLLAATAAVGAVSGSKGGYVVRNLAPGPYYLLFGACGGANIATQVYAAPGQSQPALVSAPAGVTTNGADIVEPTGATISGVIRNAAGRPVPEACVEAVPSTSTVLSQLTAAETESSSSGKYAITGLATGSYKVEFTACVLRQYAASWYGGASFFASAKTVIVKDGHVTSGINGVLRPGQTITGRVTNGMTGKALKGTCVVAYDPQGNPVSFGITGGADGGYAVPSLAPGTYSLQFGSCAVVDAVVTASAGAAAAGSATPAASASPGLAPAIRTGVKVVASRPTAGIDETLKQGGLIAGTVLGGTSAAVEPGVCVEATPTTGDGAPALGVTGSAGTYRFGPLAAGTYRLLFTTACSTGTAALAPMQYPPLVTVTPPQTTSGVDVTLESDGQISGTVTNQSSADVAGVCVTAQASGGAPVEAITASNGTYTIPSLVPGDYTVEFSSGCGATGYRTQWWHDASSRRTATVITVTANHVVTGISASLSRERG
jgi:protocatechuate 3,4-dioxygenase beta subunit